MAVDASLIQGAGAANKAATPVAALTTVNIANTLAGGITDIAKGVQERKAVFDAKLDELKAQDGLGMEYYGKFSDELADQRRKFITATPAKRNAMLIELDRQRKQLEEADLLMKDAAEAKDDYSNAWATSEEGKKFIDGMAAGPQKNEADGSYQFMIGDEPMSYDKIAETIQKNKVDKTAKKLIDAQLLDVSKEAISERGVEKPFNPAKYELTIRNIINESTNFDSLLSDNMIGTTSFLDDIAEKAGKITYEKLGLDKSVYGDEDGVINEEDVQTIVDWFKNPENRGEAQKELENYFMLYLKQNYEAQRKKYGGAVYETKQTFDSAGNLKTSETVSNTTVSTRPGDTKIVDDAKYMWSGSEWLEVVE